MNSKQHEVIERDFDVAEMKNRTWMIGIGLIFLAVVLLFCVTAYAQAANTATITFQAPTTRTDNSAITGALSYEVYQALKGATKVKVGTITGTSTTITTGLLGGKEYCWAIVAIEAGNGASAMSPDSATGANCKAFTLAAPNTVTITVQ